MSPRSSGGGARVIGSASIWSPGDFRSQVSAVKLSGLASMRMRFGR